MSSRQSRREFLKRAAGTATAFAVLEDAALASSYQAHEKLNVALIGVGGRGRWFVNTIPKLEHVVALCDVNDRRAAEAFARFPNLPKFRDFRKMLDEMGKDIDAVVVATPDHTHAVCSLTAMKQGKHVYCEKPLTHDVHEARTLRREAANLKVATQMGNQGTASEGFRRAVELIQHGAIGTVREVYAWNTNGGPGPRDLPRGTPPCPSHLEWDVWLGPASLRPFHPDWLQWHGWRDFGTGQLGNWASHTVNLVFKSLRFDQLWRPQPDAEDGHQPRRRIRLESEVSGRHRESFPRWEIVRYEVPARGELPPVKLNWLNGSGRAPGDRKMLEDILGRRLDWGDAGERKWRDHAGCILVGSRGSLHSTGHNTSYSLLPKDPSDKVESPPPTLPRSPGHEAEWLRACRGGPPAMSNFDRAGPLAEFVLLGNVATLAEQQIEYDPLLGTLVNSTPVSDLLRREYRSGWSL